MIKVKVECSQTVYLNKDVVLEFENGELPASVVKWLYHQNQFALVPFGMLNSIKEAAVEAFIEIPVGECEPEYAEIEIGLIELVK